MERVDAEKAIELMQSDLQGLNSFVVEESGRRIKRRMPVDTGTARDSVYVVAEGEGADGVFSDDKPEKILALEFGHSGQAPRGMWRITMEEIPQIIQMYLRSISRGQKKKNRGNRGSRRRTR